MNQYELLDTKKVISFVYNLARIVLDERITINIVCEPFHIKFELTDPFENSVFALISLSDIMADGVQYKLENSIRTLLKQLMYKSYVVKENF